MASPFRGFLGLEAYSFGCHRGLAIQGRPSGTHVCVGGCRSVGLLLSGLPEVGFFGGLWGSGFEEKPGAQMQSTLKPEPQKKNLNPKPKPRNPKTP